MYESAVIMDKKAGGSPIIMDESAAVSSFADLDPELGTILDNFASIFDIRIAYFLPDGSESRIGKNREISRYCKLLRTDLGLVDTCLATDEKQRHRARESGKLQSYICHGGCNEVIKPVFSDSALLGYIMIGQAVTRPGIPEPVQELAQKRGIVQEMAPAFRELPHYNRKKLDDIIQLFSELTDLVILKNLIRRKNLGPVGRICEYLQNQDHTITLEEAAAIANISKSRLRHKFLEEKGVSFTRVKQSICMEKAKKLMDKEPGLSVQEVAWQLGYADPLYFSRVFRNYFGVPPSGMSKG
jgi:AraC-like DNA-binding protein